MKRFTGKVIFAQINQSAIAHYFISFHSCTEMVFLSNYDQIWSINLLSIGTKFAKNFNNGTLFENKQ